MNDREIEEVFRTFRESFGKTAHATESTIRVNIGRHVAGLHFSNAGLATIMKRSLAHTTTTSSLLASLSIYCYEDPANLPKTLDLSDLGVQGLFENLTSERFHTAYLHGSGSIVMYDRVLQEGIYRVPTATTIPYWERSFPFRTIFHWWTSQTPYQLMHAGSIGTDPCSAIVTGKSGSGKSSTCLSAIINNDISIAGDDYILVDTEECLCYSLYNCAKLEWDGLDRIPSLVSMIDKESKSDAKAMIYLAETLPDKLLNLSRLKYCLIPEISGDQKTVIISTSPAEALKSLAPTTLFQLPLFQRESFEKCTTLLKGLDIYRVRLGKDPQEISSVLSDFLLK